MWQVICTDESERNSKVQKNCLMTNFRSYEDVLAEENELEYCNVYTIKKNTWRD